MLPGSGFLFLLLLGPAAVEPSAWSGAGYARQVQTIPVPGMAGPTGLAFAPDAGAFAVLDGPDSRRLVWVSILGQVRGEADLGTASADPLNAAWSPQGRFLLVLDREQLHAIGWDGPQMRQATVTPPGLPASVVHHARGMTIDPA